MIPEQSLPSIAVVAPSTDAADSSEGRRAHLLLQRRIVGDPLHTVAQRVHIPNGNDKSLHTVREEILTASVCGGEYGAATGERLTLHQREPLLDAGQYQ